MKIMIAVPCMDSMPVEFVKSLVDMERVGEVDVRFISCSLVYKARNDLAEMAIKNEADYVLWLDSDITFPTGLLKRLLRDAEGGRDFVTGICHMRRPPYLPCIYKVLRQGLTPEDIQDEFWEDYPRDGIFEIEGCGMACALVRTQVLRDVRAKYHTCFGPIQGYGEDLSFCLRARGCGYKIHCDPDAQTGHRTTTIVKDETFRAFKEAGLTV